VLRHLTKISLSDKPQLSHFAENLHFSNQSLKLTLEYLDRTPYRILSDVIHWKPGKDLTKKEQVQTIKKGKSKGKEKTEIVDNESFFCIFRDAYEPDHHDDYSQKSQEAGLYSFDEVSQYIQLLWFYFSKYCAPTYYGVDIPQYAQYIDQADSQAAADDDEDWSDEQKS
jgi:Nucleosome assembly protein (NAP)